MNIIMILLKQPTIDWHSPLVYKVMQTIIFTDFIRLSGVSSIFQEFLRSHKRLIIINYYLFIMLVF